MTTKPVVAAVDGSEDSLRAAEWAALEARRQSRPLQIVSAPAIVLRLHSYQASPAVIANALRLRRQRVANARTPHSPPRRGRRYVFDRKPARSAIRPGTVFC